MLMPKRQSFISRGKPFPNEYPAREAVRATEARRAKARRKQLEDEADTYLPAVFDRIAATAKAGGGRVHSLLPASCPMKIQLIVMEYLASCGYEVHPDDTGGVVVWYDDEDEGAEGGKYDAVEVVNESAAADDVEDMQLLRK